ncbi:hypothetical protein ACKAAV_003698 [Proteus mirabilis]|nr:hypothetical protein [Staphylococcus aureus]
MELRTLKSDAYHRLTQHEQVLDKPGRGYGLIYVKIKSIIFAIPLRSNLNHPYGLKTILDETLGVWNGVDYSKALIVKEDDLNPEAFKPRREDEYNKIQKNEAKIIKNFTKYLEGYISMVMENQEMKREYKFTTLQYFHAELGLPTN